MICTRCGEREANGNEARGGKARWCVDCIEKYNAKNNPDRPMEKIEALDRMAFSVMKELFPNYEQPVGRGKRLHYGFAFQWIKEQMNASI